MKNSNFTLHLVYLTNSCLCTILQTVLMAVVSFCEVEFSYDRGFLQDALRDSHQSLK